MLYHKQDFFTIDFCKFLITDAKDKITGHTFSLQSLLCVAGFLDSGCSGYPAFSLADAFDTSFQIWCLIAYCIMGLIAFCASSKPIRIKKSKKLNKDVFAHLKELYVND